MGGSTFKHFESKTLRLNRLRQSVLIDLMIFPHVCDLSERYRHQRLFRSITRGCGMEERGGLDHRASIWLWYFAIRHSGLSPSLVSRQCRWQRGDKASILVASRPFLVSFQRAALTHRPFCWERPALGGQGGVGGGFVVGRTVVLPRCPLSTYPPRAVLFLPSDDSPVCSQLT